MNENEFKQCFLFKGCLSRTGACYSCEPTDDGCPIYRYFKEIFNKSEEQNTIVKRYCDFCQNHEPGDTLYDRTSWDGGVGYDYINNIQYCPICGKKLKTWKERKEEEFKAKKELNNG